MGKRPVLNPYALAAIGILAAFLHATPPFGLAATSVGSEVDIVDYGAKNDASELATQALQRAIADAKKAGGSVIFGPPGSYISGFIELFSNMTLDVEAGATIGFSVVPLPFVQGRYLGVDALVPMPLIGLVYNLSAFELHFWRSPAYSGDADFCGGGAGREQRYTTQW